MDGCDEKRIGSAWAGLDLFLAMVIVGSSAVTGKLATVELPLGLASAIRFGLACLALVPLVIWREGGLPRLTGRSWLILGGQALTGSLLFNVLFLRGVALTSAAAAGVVVSATPACMGVLAIVFLGLRPGRGLILGISLAAAGAMIAQAPELAAEWRTAGGQGAGIGPGLLGGLCVLGAAFCESLFLLLRRGLRQSVSPLAASALVSLLAFGLFLPLAAADLAALDGLPAVGPASWLVLAWYALGVTVAAYILWFRGVSRASPGLASTMAGVMPVSGVLLAWLVLGEPWAWERAAGCLLTTGGIWLSARTSA